MTNLPDNKLEERYGFAAQLGDLTDAQLVKVRDKETQSRASGQARMYFLVCLNQELRKRGLTDPDDTANGA